MSAIGKQQARFIGSLMQRGSAFRQPFQIERAASADRLPGNYCTFPTKSRITTQPSGLRHPRKFLCCQKPRDSVGPVYRRDNDARIKAPCVINSRRIVRALSTPVCVYVWAHTCATKKSNFGKKEIVSTKSSFLCYLFPRRF